MTQTTTSAPLYTGWEDLYRNKWEWDGVYWGTHCVDCYPGDCPFHVYVRDGLVWREEQSGTLKTIEEGVPDFNPMGCQKGASWSQSLYGPDRLLYPLKRVGERGEGKWNRVTWDEALTDIAGAMVDAIEEHGSQSIVQEGTPEGGGALAMRRFLTTVGGHWIDAQGSFNDFSIGLHETFGKFSPVSSADDWFHSELVLIWHMNPVFTRIPFYHFIAEARYHGAEVVNISPDVNPSHTHADYQVPINGATDPAFGLALVQVMFEEDIADWTFLREQTDLGFLVRSDTQRYLRQTDVEGEGGREDQLYQWDPDRGLREADRGNMLLGGLEVALDGTYEVELADGSTVEVRPVCALLKEHLDANYTPEAQQEITGVHPDVVRMLARKVASKKTNIMLGYSAGKFYHGDLIERAMCLVLAASGNWGKQGTGIRCWAAGLIDGQVLSMVKPGPGAANTEIVLAARDAAVEAIKARDPTMTTEMAVREIVGRRSGRSREAQMVDPRPGSGGTAAPPAFWWYWQAGYDKRWNTPGWGDDSLPRGFDEYFDEALEQGWWEGLDRPRPDDVPQVLIECGGNMLRRTRGGKAALLETLWPKLKMIVTIDFRINQTALYADYVLPAAQHYEKLGFGMPSPHVMNLTLMDKAAEPAGEAQDEWDIFYALVEKITEIAAQRGRTEYVAANAGTLTYESLPDRYSMDGYFNDLDRRYDEVIRDSALAGTLPPRTTLATMRQQGHVRFIDWGQTPMALSQSSPLEPNKTHAPFRDHVERGAPFPTYARRAQFYIDHEWFLEAGEHLPTHKPNPNMGGDYPLGMSSGHNRWSIHTMNQANSVILGTHRGEPHVMVNTDDAKARGVEDDDLIRVFNDVSEFTARAKVAPNVKPGQIVSYNGWAGFQYPGWSGANEIEPGMVKWIAFAGGYGHLRHITGEWQPVPVDRWLTCDFEPATGAP